MFFLFLKKFVKQKWRQKSAHTFPPFSSYDCNCCPDKKKKINGKILKLFKNETYSTTINFISFSYNVGTVKSTTTCNRSLFEHLKIFNIIKRFRPFNYPFPLNTLTSLNQVNTDPSIIGPSPIPID